MTLLRFLLILRAHYLTAICVALATVGIALGVSLHLPKKYTASTALLVDIRSPDPVAALIQASSLATQIDIINSDRVAERVVTLLGLADQKGVRDQWMSATGGKGRPETWIAEGLLKGLTVTPSREGSIIGLSYTGTDPTLAAAIVNGFAQAFIDVTIELKVEPARQYAKWFAEQGKTLRESLEQAQVKLSAYEQANGIVSQDEQTDVGTARLNELTAQLTKVQAETNDARSKQRSGTTGSMLPEVMDNPVVANLRSEVSKQEAKLQEAAVNLGSNHPQYLRMQSELASLKEKLEAETQRVTRSFSASSSVGTDRESALKAAIEEQKKRLLVTKGDRNQLAVLQRDVDAARNAYETVSKRYTETELASQTKQANVSILTLALPPSEPSFPKPLGKMMLAAAGLGILLGIGSALLLEMRNRRIRSLNDLTDALPLPVLGVIPGGSAPARRLGQMHHSRLLTAK